MHAVGDVLGERSFLVALAVSFVGALLLRAVGPRVASPLPAGGAVVAVATAAGLVAGDVVPGGAGWLVIGVLLLAAGAGAHRGPLRIVSAVVLAAGAGCVAVAATQVDHHVWVGVLVTVATVGGALGAARLDAVGMRCGTGPLLFAITAGGIFVCVPDTEQAIPLMAAALGLLVVLWPPVRIRLGAAGAAALVGIALWTAAVGGTGRAGSVVGAIGCLGVFVTAPAVDAWLQRASTRPSDHPSTGEVATPVAALTLAVVHVLLVLFCARVAGFRSSALAAGMLVLLAHGVAAFTLVRTRRTAR
jgi:hypothetical protein